MTSSLDDYVRRLPMKPGVYRMYSSDAKLLYVGKARQLRRRVSQYFRSPVDSAKTAALVDKIASIETTVTNTEAEALLLEQTLIKQHRPPFNILLKDDKSYPYIRFDLDHSYPRMSFYRGKHLPEGPVFFGPFVNGLAVRESLSLLQKLFQVRQCEDVFFRNRSRPCLQHQIGRCSAPCVGLVTPEAYAQSIEACQAFLKGGRPEIISDLVVKMEAAAAELAFEYAAALRDQISALRAVQARQHVAGQSGDVDAIAVSVANGLASVNVLHVREGSVVGHQHFLVNTVHALPGVSSLDDEQPDVEAVPMQGEGLSKERSAGTEQIVGATEGDADQVVMSAFLPQFYLNDRRSMLIPAQIIASVAPLDIAVLETVLRERAGHVVRIVHRVKQDKAAWLQMSLMNAEERLRSHLSDKETQLKRMQALQVDLGLAELPERLECFDISHTAGEGTVASCVVFDQSGPRNAEYRRFNIEGVVGGDDYAAMAQVVMRRYERLRKEDARLPDLIIIDGGPGQIGRARAVLDELQISESRLLSVAKGASRKFGRETFYQYTEAGLSEVQVSAPAFGLIAHIRDEAHRFAIAGHRAKRSKKRMQSALDAIEGVGPKRRRLLLTHFGGIKGLRQASVEEIARLPGISKTLAQKILDALKAQ